MLQLLVAGTHRSPAAVCSLAAENRVTACHPPARLALGTLRMACRHLRTRFGAYRASAVHCIVLHSKSMHNACLNHDTVLNDEYTVSQLQDRYHRALLT